MLKELCIDNERCCGCGVCSLVCSQKAIIMKENEEGFLYPYVNEEICTGCMLCKRMCAFNDKCTIIDIDKSVKLKQEST